MTAIAEDRKAKTDRMREMVDRALQAAQPSGCMARYCPWPETDWPGRDWDLTPLRAPLICAGTRATNPAAVLLRNYARIKALQSANYHIQVSSKVALTRDDYEDAKRIVTAIALWWDEESRLHDGDNLFSLLPSSSLDNI